GWRASRPEPVADGGGAGTAPRGRRGTRFSAHSPWADLGGGGRAACPLWPERGPERRPVLGGADAARSADEPAGAHPARREPGLGPGRRSRQRHPHHADAAVEHWSGLSTGVSLAAGRTQAAGLDPRDDARV